MPSVKSINDGQDTRIASGAISSIAAQKKSRDRVSIFVNGEFAFGLHVDVLIAKGLAKGQELTEAEILELLAEDDFYRARFKAFHLLSYRTRTRFEMSQRLLRSGYSRDTIDRVLERLSELGMMDDRLFAREFVESRIRSKGFGPLRLRNELAKKGVASEYVDEALREAYQDESPEVLALRAARRYLPRLEKEKDAGKRRKKLSSFLARRGFTYEQMTEALEELQILDRKTV